MTSTTTIRHIVAMPNDIADGKESFFQGFSLALFLDYVQIFVGVQQSHLERAVADKDAVHLTIGGRDDKRQEDEAAVQRGAEGAGAG